VVNNLLQGDLAGAATNTLRFALNSTVGFLGLADPADAIGLREVETDFGATLARWGVPEGAYLELPGFGPSTERDALGRVVDFVIDPLDRIGELPDPIQDLSFPAEVAEQVIERGELGDTLDEILYEARTATRRRG
jgi:phospholipid-binding lipoprotein MlaA